MSNEIGEISGGALTCAPPGAATQLVSCEEPARQRYKRWPREERARIVAESFNTNRSIAQVARDNGVSDALLYYWRRQERAGEAAEMLRFVPVRVGPEPQAPAAAIEALVGDVRLLICSAVDVGQPTPYLRRPGDDSGRWQRADLRGDTACRLQGWSSALNEPGHAWHGA